MITMTIIVTIFAMMSGLSLSQGDYMDGRFNGNASSLVGNCNAVATVYNTSSAESTTLYQLDDCFDEHSKGWIFSCANSTSVTLQEYEYDNCTGNIVNTSTLSQGDYPWYSYDPNQKVYFNCEEDALDCTYTANYYWYSDSSCSGTGTLFHTETEFIELCEYSIGLNDYGNVTYYRSEGNTCGDADSTPVTRYKYYYNNSINCSGTLINDETETNSGGECVYWAEANIYYTGEWECASCTCPVSWNADDDQTSTAQPITTTNSPMDTTTQTLTPIDTTIANAIETTTQTPVETSDSLDTDMHTTSTEAPMEVGGETDATHTTTETAMETATTTEIEAEQNADGATVLYIPFVNCLVSLMMSACAIAAIAPEFQL